MSQQAELMKENLVGESAPPLQRDKSTIERTAPTTGVPSIIAWNSGRSGNESLATSIVEGTEKDLGVKSQKLLNAQVMPLENKFQETEAGKRTQPSHKNDKYPDEIPKKNQWPRLTPSHGPPLNETVKRLPHPKRGAYPGIRLA
ncbi:MAG TPA: hypothetical protein VGZ00_01725 [Candidatus Baltobacteraceae bacterium]|jgi:hypothetical protein|nr:hypothetical protein [Candidatus Baltobacteraceae bacterium]